MVPPFQLGIGLSIPRGGVSGGLDVDAAAYIALLGEKGVTPTETQAAALEVFFSAGWTRDIGLKRLYLPIWADENANAIDLVELTEGAFVNVTGDITHEAGFVRGNNNGYFDTQSNVTTIGLTTDSGYMGALKLSSAGNGSSGSYKVSNTTATISHFTTAVLRGEWGGSFNRYTTPTLETDSNGIFSTNRLNSETRLRLRRLGSRQSHDFGQTADPNHVITTDLDFFFLGRNNDGTPDSLNIADMGAYWLGLGVYDYIDKAFTLALQTLWESCTGLTIPGTASPVASGMTGQWSVTDPTTLLKTGDVQASPGDTLTKITPLVGSVDLIPVASTYETPAGFRPRIEMDGVTSVLDAAGVLGTAFTVMVAAKRREFTSAAGFIGTGNSALQLYQAGGGQSLTLGCLSGGVYTTQVLETPEMEMNQVFGWRVGTGPKFSAGDSTEKVFTGTPASTTDLQIGFATGLTARSKLDVFEVLVWDRALTDFEYTNARDYLTDKWKGSRLLVSDGDSILTDAYSDSIAEGIAADSAWINQSTLVWNNSFSGDTTAQILASLDADTFGRTNAQRQILLVDGGINDVNGSVSAATAFTNLEEIYIKAKNLGFVVIATANHEHGSWTGTQDTINSDLNALIRASDLPDHVLPLDTLFPTPHVAEYFVDGVHFTQAGVDIVVTYLLDSILSNYQ